MSSLLAICIPLAAFALMGGSLLWKFYLEELQGQLTAHARLIADAAAGPLLPDTPDDIPALERLIERWQTHANMRLTICNARGEIVARAAADTGQMRVDESRQPGMLAALSGVPNSTVWKSPNYGYEDTMYVNLPVLDGSKVIGVVRVAYTLTQIQQKVSRIQAALFITVVLYGLLIVGLSLMLATAIASPVERLNRGARLLAAGQLDHQIPPEGTEEIRNLADTLNQMSARLLGLEVLRRQYVSDVSHELRTPLAAIRAMAETIQVHGDSDPETRARYVSRIVNQTDRLARVATQLLDLAHIESGHMSYSLTPVSLDSIMEGAAQAVLETYSQKGVYLKTDIQPDLPMIRGDADRLVQVFVNLLANAVRHTPKGGTVSVSAMLEHDVIVATVRDTGDGIPAEHLPHIFERFYRVDKHRSARAGGTGLGLAIVRQIIEGHGGSISVESTIGSGTVFTVRLPVEMSERGEHHLRAANVQVS